MIVLPARIFCDGGVIGANPSPHGGTWCYVWVDSNNEAIKHKSGIITPEQLQVEKITNNQSELFAAMKAMESISKTWKGCICSDSLITLYRITTSKSFKGIPNWMRLKVLELRRMVKWNIELVGGHPTKKDLAMGMNDKSRPVSIHNVFCDKECGRIAKGILEGKRDSLLK